ncbi:transposase [Halomonas kenyensis]|uniref:Transposase n=1 Tax=Billgrantia kenyensis TaxID=321266 RepID=A0A7V9W506_9GAMM|nr:transposase [Halomonas kenyensis]MCG6663865.1 hypothetical protein [Halomonas kenyensis]
MICDTSFRDSRNTSGWLRLTQTISRDDKQEQTARTALCHRLGPLHGSPQWLYDHRYCPHGDTESRIKEQQWLFSDRTSCHDWSPNQYRLLLAGLAYFLWNGCAGCS